MARNASVETIKVNVLIHNLHFAQFCIIGRMSLTLNIPANSLKYFMLFSYVKNQCGDLRHFSIVIRTSQTRVFTTFRILEISYTSNVFFCFVYHSKMAQISRNYTKFFYANLYKIPRYFEKFCDLLYQFFLTIQHRRHFLHTAEKLQDADWRWGRYDNTPLNPYPFTAAC